MGVTLRSVIAVRHGNPIASGRLFRTSLTLTVLDWNKFSLRSAASQVLHSLTLGVSTQNINDIEGKRRWPRESTLIKIAEILEIEVYQLFIPQNLTEIKIEETNENQQIQRQIQNKLGSDFRKSMNKMLDKWNQIDL